MKKIFCIIGISFLFLSQLITPVLAADIRGDEYIRIGSGEENVSDLYVFGNSITVDAPVQNDVVAAGGSIAINNAVTGDLMAAGGTINVDGTIEESARVAGGDLRFTKPIGRDAIIAGGNITFTNEASVAGDLVVMGGQIRVEGPVQGSIRVNGGDVFINTTVGGNVEGNVETLTLGPNALIQGDLRYRSGKQLRSDPSAVIQGRTDFQRTEKDAQQTRESARSLITGFSIFMLISNILFGLFLLWLLRKFTGNVMTHISVSPMGTGLTGLLAFFIIPLISLFLLVLILPGIFGFLVYFILLMLAGLLASIYVGYIIMLWWERRSNRTYMLNWTAVVLGAIVMYLLNLIPVIGWLLNTVLFFLALGGIIREFLNIRDSQRISPAQATVPESKSITPRSAVKSSRPAKRRS